MMMHAWLPGACIQCNSHHPPELQQFDLSEGRTTKHWHVQEALQAGMQLARGSWQQAAGGGIGGRCKGPALGAHLVSAAALTVIVAALLARLWPGAAATSGRAREKGQTAFTPACARQASWRPLKAPCIVQNGLPKWSGLAGCCAVRPRCCGLLRRIGRPVWNCLASGPNAPDRLPLVNTTPVLQPGPARHFVIEVESLQSAPTACCRDPAAHRYLLSH